MWAVRTRCHLIIRLSLFIGTTHSRSLTMSPSVPADLAEWISDITSRPPIISSEVLDSHRAGHLRRALPTRQGAPVPLGDKLDAGHHLVYFQPETRLVDLGPDGSSTEYNPPAPFSRRMWAGGSMHFRSPLFIDTPVTQRVSVPSIEYKKGMVFVNQQRDLYSASAASGNDWAMREIRTHVFRRGQDVRAALTSSSPFTSPSTPTTSTPFPSSPSPTGTPSEPEISLTYTPTSPLLFLFSALTHNAHKIHYDRPWTQDVEGHPDLLVHAPLTALLLLELAGRVGQVKAFEYRATSPTYVDIETALSARWDGVLSGRRLELLSQQQGRTGMRANAVIA